jgi:hypothetical protein
MARTAMGEWHGVVGEWRPAAIREIREWAPVAVREWPAGPRMALPSSLVLVTLVLVSPVLVSLA